MASLSNSGPCRESGLYRARPLRSDPDGRLFLQPSGDPDRAADDADFLGEAFVAVVLGVEGLEHDPGRIGAGHVLDLLGDCIADIAFSELLRRHMRTFQERRHFPFELLRHGLHTRGPRRGAGNSCKDEATGIIPTITDLNEIRESGCYGVLPDPDSDYIRGLEISGGGPTRNVRLGSQRKASRVPLHETKKQRHPAGPGAQTSASAAGRETLEPAHGLACARAQ